MLIVFVNIQNCETLRNLEEVCNDLALVGDETTSCSQRVLPPLLQQFLDFVVQE